MKFLLPAFFVLTLSSCATKPAKTTAEIEQMAVKSEAAYGGQCAMGVCLKKNVKGDEKYSVDYKGKHYIFSSPEAKDNFLAKIDENIKKADKNWMRNIPDRAN